MSAGAALPKAVTITLRTPVVLGPLVVETIELPPLDGEMMREIGTGPLTVGALLDLAERMTKLPRKVFDRLRPSDARQVTDQVLLFLLDAPEVETGPSSPGASA